MRIRTTIIATMFATMMQAQGVIDMHSHIITPEFVSAQSLQRMQQFSVMTTYPRRQLVTTRNVTTDWFYRDTMPEDAKEYRDWDNSNFKRALVAIFSDEFLASQLAFRGGTALHKLYLSPQPRYSEDIDLVQVTPGPIKPIMYRLGDVFNTNVFICH